MHLVVIYNHRREQGNRKDKAMKHYNAEVYRRFSHGRYGAEYKGIVTVGVEAKTKKEAKEIVKAYMEDYEFYDEDCKMTFNANMFNLTIDITEA